VHPQPREALIKIFNETLEAVKAIPESAAYRQSVVELTKNRLGVVETTEDVKEIEKKLKSGQIEQVILQAKDELNLVHKMLEWKPWEDLETKPSADQWEYFKQGGKAQ
jgi:NADH dehydrogenase (ubiquinone) 1 alpha subcomplex subunit 5